MCEGHKTRYELLNKGIISVEDNYMKNGKLSNRYELLNYVKSINSGLHLIVSELDGNKGERLSLFERIRGNYKFVTEEEVNILSEN